MLFCQSIFMFTFDFIILILKGGLSHFLVTLYFRPAKKIITYSNADLAICWSSIRPMCNDFATECNEIHSFNKF